MNLFVLATLGLAARLFTGLPGPDKELPDWFGRSGPSPYLSMKLSNFGCGPTESLVPYTETKAFDREDPALKAYVTAFRDYRHGKLVAVVRAMFPQPGKKISPYQVAYLSVAYMLSPQLSGEAQESVGMSQMLIREKSGSDTVQTPLGYLLFGSFASHFRYAKAREVLGESVEKFPREKGLWDSYAWACESGEIPVGQSFDPRSSAFGYAEAIRAREKMATRWPGDDYNLARLAEDLDFLGEKVRARSILEGVVRRHKADDETGKLAKGLLAYFQKGGFKR